MTPTLDVNDLSLRLSERPAGTEARRACDVTLSGRLAP